jgi:hypothetical protein
MRDAILTAGLTTVAGASQPGASAAGSIAMGALQGRQAGAQGREGLVQQQGREQMAQLAEGGIDIPTARQMLVQSMRTGDMETAKYLTAMITSMQANQAQQAPNIRFTEQTLGDSRFQIGNDPQSGAELFRRELGPAQAPNIQFAPPVSDEMGERSVYAVDRSTGGKVYWGQAPGGGGDSFAQKNENLARIMDNAEQVLAQHDSELARPIVSVLSEWSRDGGVFGTLANVGLQAISPEGQMASAARDRWVSAFVPILSGAQMTELERANYRVAFTTQGGDSAEVQRQKAQARALAAIMFQADPTQLDSAAANKVLERVGLPVPAPETGANPFMRPGGR